MAMLISLETLTDTLLPLILKRGGKPMELDGKQYIRIDEVSYLEACEEAEREMYPNSDLDEDPEWCEAGNRG